MKIAVISSLGHLAGGCEVYLKALIPALIRSGETVAFWHEFGLPPGSTGILSEDVPSWCAEERSCEEWLQALHTWNPDLLYVHGLAAPDRERAILKMAPAAAFLHGFYGACISGTRLWKQSLQPCSRTFGAACLLVYYPRHCGGWNPVTMWSEFKRQKQRLRLLLEYRALITHSDFMVSLFQKHGIPENRIFKVGFPIQRHFNAGAESQRAASFAQPWRLLFVGRCEIIKGGSLLLDALPQCVSRLDQPIELTFAGTGPERAKWERHAADLMQRFSKLQIRFEGWTDSRRLQALREKTDLAVFPSLWPEPFGMSGAEAVLEGIPVVAFDVGGVREWLKPEENGVLAPGNPPTAGGLAEAIVMALQHLARTRPRSSPIEPPSQFEMKAHLQDIGAIFNAILNR